MGSEWLPASGQLYLNRLRFGRLATKEGSGRPLSWEGDWVFRGQDTILQLHRKIRRLDRCHCFLVLVALVLLQSPEAIRSVSSCVGARPESDNAPTVVRTVVRTVVPTGLAQTAGGMEGKWRGLSDVPVIGPPLFY